MIEIVYTDERGAGHVHYPRSAWEAESHLKRLRNRRIGAEMRCEGRRVGAVEPDPRPEAQGAYTWWLDPHVFD